MKSYLFAILFAVSLLATSSCADSADDIADLADVADSADSAEPTAPEAQSTTANPLFAVEPVEAVAPQGEEIWWRCSTTFIPYPTRSFCLSECPGGTCRLTLVCTNDSTGEQIPCP